METVSFSPDSKQLASGGWDKRVMLWEVQVCGRVARAGPGTRRRHTPPPTVAPERLFHLPYCPCPQLAIHLPMRLTWPGLSSPVKAQVVSPDPVSSPYPCSSQRGPDLTYLRPRIWYKTSGLSSKAQGSLLQSGQMLRHLGGHQDAIQSSDFAPSSDFLVSHTTSA